MDSRCYHRHHRVGKHTHPTAREQEAGGRARQWSIEFGKPSRASALATLQETRWACYEALCTAKMEQGQDPEEFFKTDDLRTRLGDMSELISEERYKDTRMQAITDD